jgi:hypothetical protein
LAARKPIHILDKYTRIKFKSLDETTRARTLKVREQPAYSVRWSWFGMRCVFHSGIGLAQSADLPYTETNTDYQ